jgi:hypothetical protein
MRFGNNRLALLRSARALFLYVCVSSVVLVFGCWLCEGAGRPAFMLVSSAVGAFGLERRSRTVWGVALLGSIFGMVVFISRLPFYFQRYEIAVGNAGWKTFLWANSLFLALAIAGVLSALTIPEQFRERFREESRPSAV